MVEECQKRNIRPVWICLPFPKQDVGAPDDSSEKILARKAGFTILDLTGVYDEVDDVSSLWIAEWDHHPNPQGHQMIAARLYQLIEENDEVLFNSAINGVATLRPMR